MADDIIKTTKKWVESQGFALEMRAASEFRRAGFEIRQSPNYLDRDEGKYRETDVIARHPDSFDKGAAYVTVDCKASKHPWTCLISADSLKGLNRLSISGVLSHDAAARVNKIPEGIGRFAPWLLGSDECGYAFRKAHTERDDAYAGAIAVCKAAQWCVHNYQGDMRALPPFAVALPLIVVNTPIFECRLDDDGEITLREVFRTAFLFEDKGIYDTLTQIRVVHIDHLATFMKELWDVTNLYLSLFQPTK